MVMTILRAPAFLISLHNLETHLPEGGAIFNPPFVGEEVKSLTCGLLKAKRNQAKLPALLSFTPQMLALAMCPASYAMGLELAADKNLFPRGLCIPFLPFGLSPDTYLLSNPSKP